MNAPHFATLPVRAHSTTSSTPPVSHWGDEVEHILCVRLDHLGDVLMTTPAFRALRRGARKRDLTLLTSPAGAAIAPWLDDVDQVLVHDAPWVSARPRASYESDLALRATLAAGRFDAAVIFTVYSQNPLPAALLCYLAGIPRRLAYCRENPYALLSDWVREPEPETLTRHEVERQLALVAQTGAPVEDTRMRFAVRDADRYALAAKLEAHEIDAGRRWVVMHVGANAASRRYPPDRFAQVAHGLAEHEHCEVLLTGSEAERELIDAVARDAGPGVEASLHRLAGVLSLGELAALLERAALLVSNNSGPVHLASALATPVVDLYALTNPQHTPWQTPHHVLYQDVACRWCYRSVCPEGHHRCLLGVSTDQVLQAAHALLRDHPRRDPAQSRHLAQPEPPPGPQPACALPP
jgi:lipopolysaccharide heptosyltransferase II